MATKADTPKTVPVPETLLKAKKTAAQRRELRRKDKEFTLKRNKVARREAFKKAEKYENEYKKAELDLIRNRRVSRAGGTSFFVEPEAKVLLVIRIRGIFHLFVRSL
jgi:large subunit ribosomal protein L7e